VERGINGEANKRSEAAVGGSALCCGIGEVV
jgi:hypothetical protein